MRRPSKLLLYVSSETEQFTSKQQHEKVYDDLEACIYKGLFEKEVPQKNMTCAKFFYLARFHFSMQDLGKDATNALVCGRFWPHTHHPQPFMFVV